MSLRARCLAAIVSAIFCTSPGLSQSITHIDPETGYRISRYRAPTPESAPGATTISVDLIEGLVRDEDAILIDAMPAEGAGPDPETGVWRLSRKRVHIPGSVWLPEIGKGRLSTTMEAYFRSNLERLTGGVRSRALIFYCLADCWMGWNAAKRAVAYGYRRVFWFPEGSDGWRDWDGQLVEAVPVPLERGMARIEEPDRP